jgi:thiamine kinase-like enzyme
MKFSPYTTPAQQTCLPPLLAYLQQTTPAERHLWHDWTLERIFGGQNNIIYHANHACGELAVKITRQDERNRAIREYHSLLVLQEAGLDVAPVPLALDCESYHGRQIVVQSWLDGKVSEAPPQTEAEWTCLLDHILLTHTVSPQHTAVPLPAATLAANHPLEFMTYLKQYVANLPTMARLKPLQQLITKLESKHYPAWPLPQQTLLHCDANPCNFVRRPSIWQSVDWENSGWGDPAFEIADLITHPRYMDVTEERWQWVIEHYGERMGSEAAACRIRTYIPIMLTWWVIRLARALYEIPRGLDERLIPREANWQANTKAKYSSYLQRATQALSR